MTQTEPCAGRLLLTVDQARAELAISRAAMYRLMAADRLRTVRIGRSRRVPRMELEAFVASLTGRGTPRT